MENLNEMARINFRGRIYASKNDLVAYLMDQGYNAARAFQYIQEYAPDSGLTRGSVASMYSRLSAQRRAIAHGLAPELEQPAAQPAVAPEAQEEPVQAQNEPEQVNDQPEQNNEPEQAQNAPRLAQTADELDDEDEAAPVPSGRLNMQIPEWARSGNFDERDIEVYTNAKQTLHESGWMPLHLVGTSLDNVELFYHNNYFSVIALYIGNDASIRHIENLRLPFVENLFGRLSNNWVNSLMEYYTQVCDKLKSKLIESNNRIQNSTHKIMIYRSSIRFDDATTNIQGDNGLTVQLKNNVAAIAAIVPYRPVNELSREINGFFKTVEGQITDVSGSRHSTNFSSVVNQIIQFESNITGARIALSKLVKKATSKILRTFEGLESSVSVFVGDEFLNALDNTESFLQNNIPDATNNYGHLDQINKNPINKAGVGTQICLTIRLRSFNYNLIKLKILTDYTVGLAFGISDVRIKEFVKKMISPDVAEEFFNTQNITSIDVGTDVNLSIDRLCNIITDAYAFARQAQSTPA